MTRKSKARFGMKGYSPFTKTYTDDEKLKLWEQWKKEQEEEEKDEDKRLKLHRPEEGDY
jgi:hypothetical protein